MSGRVTISDVATAAGVSAMTVSNVVNGRGGASPETRSRVLELASGMGYVANLAARGLKGGRTGLVGVVMLDLTGQYAQEITRGIADALAEEELEVLISASYHDASRERQRAELLGRGLVDGMILIAPVLDPETARILRRLPCPVVIIDPRQNTSDFPHIVVDNYGGMRSATEHLLSQGHREIAFIGGDTDFASSNERLAGYVDAIVNARLKVEPRHVRVADFTYEGGKRALAELLRDYRPSAVLAASDLIAFGVIDAARERGLSVPADISVVGFDDLPQANDSFPALTTVRQPLHDMGEIAVRTLLSLLEGSPLKNSRIELPTTLVRRGTVEPVRPIDVAGVGDVDPLEPHGKKAPH